MTNPLTQLTEKELVEEFSYWRDISELRLKTYERYAETDKGLAAWGDYEDARENAKAAYAELKTEKYLVHL